jgi:WD40 repeat protein
MARAVLLGLALLCWASMVAWCPAAPLPGKVVILEGHRFVVTWVAFSPDGKTLASSSRDNTVKLWDVGQGKLLATLEGHTGGVHALAFSPDGKTVATGGGDSTVRLWDVASGKNTATFKTVGHAADGGCLAFSPDGKALASSCHGGPVNLWNIDRAGPQPPPWRQITVKAHTLSYTSKGRLLTVEAFQGAIVVWDAVAEKKIATLEKPIFNRSTVATFSPDGRTIAMGGELEVQLWDTTTGKKKADPYLVPGRWVTCLAFSPDGKTLAASYKPPDQSNAYGDIQIRDVASGKLLDTLKSHKGAPFCVAFSPDGKTLASGCIDGTIKLWPVPDGKKTDE